MKGSAKSLCVQVGLVCSLFQAGARAAALPKPRTDQLVLENAVTTVSVEQDPHKLTWIARNDSLPKVLYERIRTCIDVSN